MTPEEEIRKCIDSPYYFATKYLVVNGKPFETPLSEKAFNSFFNKMKSIPAGTVIGKRRNKPY